MKTFCKSHPLQSSFILSALFFALFFTFAHPVYETNDDFGLMGIASGLYSDQPSETLVVTNVIIGKLLKQLYHVTQVVNWYSLYLYTIHFLSIWAFLYVFLCRKRLEWTFPFFVLVLFFFELRFLLLVQFTTTAFVALQSGILLLLHLTNRKTRTPFYAFLPAVFFIVLGTMVRRDALYLVLMLSLPLALFQFLKAPSKNIPIFIGIAGVLSLAAIQYDRHYYTTDNGWRQFFEWTTVRGSINERPLPPFDATTRSVLESMGWSKNDALMFYTWFFADPEIYSTENLNILLNHVAAQKRTIPQAWDYFRPELYRLRVFFWFTLLNFLLCIMVVSGKKSRFLIPSLLTAAMAAGICWYLSASLKLPDRVLLPIVFFINAAFFFQLGDAEKPKPKPGFSSRARLAKAAVFVVFVSLYIHLSFQQWKVLSSTNQYNMERHQAFNGLVEDLLTQIQPGKQESPLYVVVGTAFPYEWGHPLCNFKRFRKLFFLPYGWYTHSPPYDATMKRFSIGNVYQALYKRHDMILISSTQLPDILKTFVREHFDVEIQFEDLTSRLGRENPLIDNHLKHFHIYKICRRRGD